MAKRKKGTRKVELTLEDIRDCLRYIEKWCGLLRDALKDFDGESGTVVVTNEFGGGLNPKIDDCNPPGPRGDDDDDDDDQKNKRKPKK